MRNRKTFDQLFRAHYDDVCEEARRHGVRAADAEDVAQEAFLQYTQIRPRYAQAPPGRLLRSIAKNRARNFRRKNRRRKPIPHLDPATSPTPEELMRLSQGRALMARITRELPEHLRRVYVMVDLEGIELAEIAQTLGIPLGTVKSRLHAARAAIDATVQQLARNNELPAILLPLFFGFGRGRGSWRQKIFGFVRPLTVGLAACFVVPHIPDDSPRAAAEVIVPASDELASGSARAAEPVTSLGGEPAGTERMASSTGDAVAEQKASAVKAGGKSHHPEQPSETGRRDLELMQLQDVQSAYDAGDIDGARKRMEEFDKKYPKPYLSRERDRLAARIEQAKVARLDPP